MNQVITEKYKKFNYVDEQGYFVWLNRYGDIIKREDKNGYINYITRYIEVAAGNRRVRASWTPEMIQNLQIFHNIDVEAELTALLSEEMAREIDREIIKDLLHISEKL